MTQRQAATTRSTVVSTSPPAPSADLTSSTHRVDVLQAAAPVARCVRTILRRIGADGAASMPARESARSINDESFRITRLVMPWEERQRVVFFATDLRTGAVRQLNGTRRLVDARS